MKNLDELKNLAAALKGSNLLPEHLRNNEADMLLVMLTGEELGLSPLQSLRSFYPVRTSQGTVLTLTADAMLAVMYQNGIRFPVMEFTAQRAHIKARRQDGQEYETEFTMEDARRAGLTERPMYSRYPDRMLRARAIARVFRDLAPHFCGSNLWAPEELDEYQQPQKPAEPEPDNGGYYVGIKTSDEQQDQASPETEQASAEEVTTSNEQDWVSIPLPQQKLVSVLSELKSASLRNRAKDPKAEGRMMASILRYAWIDPHGNVENMVTFVSKLALFARMDPEFIAKASMEDIAKRVMELIDPLADFVKRENLESRFLTLLHIVAHLSDLAPVPLIRALESKPSLFQAWIERVRAAKCGDDLWEAIEWLASSIRNRNGSTE